MRLATISILFLGLATLLTAVTPAYAIGPWTGADASGNTIFLTMTHEGDPLQYVHVWNIPPAVVSPEWAEDTSGPSDFSVVIINPATATAIQRNADAIIPIGPGTDMILRRGQTYIFHTQACHHTDGGEHEHHDAIADSPTTCATHAGTDPWMWHPDLLVMLVDVM